MKKILLYMMMLLPMVASAEAVEIDGIYYNLITKPLIAEVAEGPNAMYYSGKIEIPSTIEYHDEIYNVKYIGVAAFANCKDLTDIKLPNSIEIIKMSAFSCCRGFESIILPNSLKEIENGAFRDCKDLISITIGTGLEKVESLAFDGCINLKHVNILDIGAWCNIDFIGASSSPLDNTDRLYFKDEELNSIVIPEGTTRIGGNTFRGLKNIKSVSIPNSVMSIGSFSFARCVGLKSIDLPNNINSIDGGAFSGCTGLTSFIIPSNVTILSGGLFSDCENLNEIYIPSKVERIQQSVFSECKHLHTVVIPKSVSYILNRAFEKCPELSSVYLYSEDIPYYVSEDIFADSYIQYSTLYVPESSIEKYQKIKPWSDFGNIKRLPHVLYFVDGIEYMNTSPMVGSIITEVNPPIKEGYTFSGWSEIPETMPDHDITITGSFIVNKYKLTYKVDGVEYKTSEVEYGTTITAEDEPTKEGYTFSGWSEIPETMPAKDVVISGTFSINSYTITYKIDGEVFKTESVEYGSVITPPEASKKEGYTFEWIDVPKTMPAHDVTVTGTFTVNKYKLTYMVDGVEYKISEVEYGSAIVAEEEPTKEGYTFSGWSEIPETMPAHDVIISGNFTINSYTITYMIDGEVFKTEKVEYGAIITPPMLTKREGYTFSGWSEIPETMPAKDIVITGTFAINSYTITYMIDGEVFKTESVEYGSAITPPEAPAREGYTFEWIDVPETMPAKDIIIEGSYTLGIGSVYIENGGDMKWYTIGGKRIETPQKGLNIMKKSNGKTKKVLVK